MHELAEVMEKMKPIKELKEKLVDCFKSEISTKGLECIDTKEAGEVVDMIKDFSEAEKSCMEALYYQKVIEAMVSYDDKRYDDEDSMGYNPNRSSSTGRYISRRSGGRMGFRPHMPYLDYDGDMTGENYDYLRGAMLGYDGDSNRGGRMSSNNSGNRSGNRGNMGYGDGDDRYGKAYNEYKTMRKYYTETGSQEDKREMETHAEEHMHDTITTIRDIWKDAEPSLRKRMKEDLTKLVGEMTV